MAYDEALAERITAVFFDEPEMTSKKMFGGIAFMVDGHMAVGVVGEDLMVRLGPRRPRRRSRASMFARWTSPADP